MRWPLVSEHSEQKDEGSCHAFNSPPSLLLNLLFLITIGRKLYSIFQVPSKRLKQDDRLGLRNNSRRTIHMDLVIEV